MEREKVSLGGVLEKVRLNEDGIEYFKNLNDHGCKEFYASLI